MGVWHFCEDELPEIAEAYLVLWKIKGTDRIFYEIQEFNEEEGWIIDIKQAYGKPVEIIAWTDFPEIPEELRYGN